MPFEITKAETPEEERIDALRAQLADARSRTRHSLMELESEIRTEIVSVTHWPQVFQSHRACFLSAAAVLGFLYGQRR